MICLGLFSKKESCRWHSQVGADGIVFFVFFTRGGRVRC